MTPTFAIVVALVSALFFALTDFTLRKGLQHSTPDMGALVSVAAQWVAYTVIIGVAGGFSGLTGVGFGWFFLTGIMTPGLFLIFFMIGIQRIGVARTSPIKGSGPIITAILAFFFLADPFGLRTALPGALRPWTQVQAAPPLAARAFQFPPRRLPPTPRM